MKKKKTQQSTQQNFALPKLPKHQSIPKYLEVEGYKDYKYKSYLIDMLKADKKTQKLLPYHLQSLPRTYRKRYELNDSTRLDLLHSNQLDNIFTDTQADTRKQSAITQNGMSIANNYNKLVKSYQQDSFITNKDTSLFQDEITQNNIIIGNIIEYSRQLTVNPRLIKGVRQTNFREMDSIKEFKVLVNNTKQYLDMQGLPAYMDHPFIFQFILRNSYNSFKEITQILQDRILLCFEINPYNDEEKVYYGQFSKFKQIVIAQHYKFHELIDFFIKFFNSSGSDMVSTSDVRTLLYQILENQKNMSEIVEYQIKNLNLFIGEETPIFNLRRAFESNVIDVHQLIELLLNNF